MPMPTPPAGHKWSVSVYDWTDQPYVNLIPETDDPENVPLVGRAASERPEDVFAAARQILLERPTFLAKARINNERKRLLSEAYQCEVRGLST